MAFYKDGVISIPNVTGDVVITATAVQSQPQITNLIDVYGVATNTRLSTSSGGNSTQSGHVTIGSDTTKLITVASGDIIRIKGASVSIPTTSSGLSSICLYQEGGTHAGASTAKSLFVGQTNGYTITLSGGIYTIVCGSVVTSTNCKMRLCFPCTDTTDLIITKNEEIPA